MHWFVVWMIWNTIFSNMTTMNRQFVMFHYKSFVFSNSNWVAFLERWIVIMIFIELSLMGFWIYKQYAMSVIIIIKLILILSLKCKVKLPLNLKVITLLEDNYCLNKIWRKRFRWHCDILYTKLYILLIINTCTIFFIGFLYSICCIIELLTVD